MCGVIEDYQKLFENMVKRGWSIKIIPSKNYSLPSSSGENTDHEFNDVGVKIADQTDLNQCWGILFAHILMTRNGDHKDYCTTMGIKNGIPFEEQFEAFLDGLDKSYYEFVLPHVSGRFQNDETES